jgi:hypothetical protein
MGFNRRKMEDQRRQVVEKEAASRRATDAQALEDAERLIAAWNERQAKRMPMLFSPTIGAAITAGYWFLSVHCPACRTTNAIDLRTLDRHRDAAVTSLIPALSSKLFARAARNRRGVIDVAAETFERTNHGTHAPTDRGGRQRGGFAIPLRSPLASKCA